MKRRRRHAAQQGMTLIEIMLVVVIMAMIASAVGFAVMGANREANLNIAKTGVRNMVAVAEAYSLQHPGAPCPSMDDLTSSRMMRRGNEPNDPWGTEYRIECDEGDVNVRSAGPDRQLETEDDVTAF